MTPSCCTNTMHVKCVSGVVCNQIYIKVVDHVDTHGGEGVTPAHLRQILADLGPNIKCPFDNQFTINIQDVIRKYRECRETITIPEIIPAIDQEQEEHEQAVPMLLLSHFLLYFHGMTFCSNPYRGHTARKHGHVTGDQLLLDRDFFAPEELGRDEMLARPDREHHILTRIELLLSRVILDCKTPDQDPQAVEGDDDDDVALFDRRSWAGDWMPAIVSMRMGAYFVEQIGHSTTSTHGNRAIMTLQRDPNNLDQIIVAASIQSADHAIEEWPERHSSSVAAADNSAETNDLQEWFDDRRHNTVSTFTMNPNMHLGPTGEVYNLFPGLPHVDAARQELLGNNNNDNDNNMMNQFVPGTFIDTDFEHLIAEVEQEVEVAASAQELRTLDPLRTLLYAIHASWCASDMPTTISTLKLLSLWVQHPGVKQDVFLLLKGRKGGQGKSLLLLELFLARVVGMGIGCLVQDVSEITNDFQANANQMFKVFDDMPKLNSQQATALGTQVTSSFNKEHLKYKQQCNVPNRCNQAGCTNHDQPFLEANRRTHLLVCADVLVPADGITIIRDAAAEAKRVAFVDRLVEVCTSSTSVGPVAMTALLLLADVRNYNPREHVPASHARELAQAERAARAIQAEQAAERRHVQNLALIEQHRQQQLQQNVVVRGPHDHCLVVLLHYLLESGAAPLQNRKKYHVGEWMGMAEEVQEIYPLLPFSDIATNRIGLGRRMARLMGPLWRRGLVWRPRLIRAQLESCGVGIYDPNVDWRAVLRQYSGGDDADDEEQNGP